MSKQLPRAARTAQLLEVALNTAERRGIWKMTRNEIAEGAGVTMALVTLYLGTMVQIQRSVIRHAIHTRRIPVIAEALARGNTCLLYTSDAADE